MASLSVRELKDLRDSLADQENSPSQLTEKLSAAIDAADAVVAAGAIAPLGATGDLEGVDGSGQDAASLVNTEARLDAIEAKVDAIIAALSS